MSKMQLTENGAREVQEFIDRLRSVGPGWVSHPPQGKFATHAALIAIDYRRSAEYLEQLLALALNGETGTQNSLSANAQDEVAHRPE